MLLKSGDFTDNSKLRLTCLNVTHCRFASEMTMQVVHIHITLMRDRGWEGVNYIVRDDENDQVYLRCEAFAAEVVVDSSS